MSTLQVFDVCDLATIPGQIAELGNASPRSIALIAGDRQLTYEEVNRRADRFADYLWQLGVGLGSTVAISMERSFDWIIAALGTMRAGAAYVPLDSTWPESRLRFAVNDSGASVLVARAALLDRLHLDVHSIDPCRDSAVIATCPIATRPSIEPESLAYLIYTSGSSGFPKGVEITHANLSHLVRWHRDAFGVTSRDRASHLAGLGFDAAVWEIWPNLSAGATVCLADDTLRSSPELIRQWMILERITVGFVPTVYAEPMMAMQWPAETALRFLLTGGDALQRGPNVSLPFRVVNNYGPTECTVVSTSTVLSPGIEGTPPIGRPISGASVYLLNDEGRQIPDGVTGEIYIRGGGVGRGYRNLPDATAQFFLPDPFSRVPGAMMYRTGDLGRRRPDGEIDFCGRLDRQAKIRGHRIELDEIGKTLNQHACVEFATALAKISETGEKRLVAYVLPKANVPVLTIDDLQKHLLKSLPSYMVPAVFVRLETLPVSANGKLDLTILAQSADTNLLERTIASVPATEIEGRLLAIMRELLGNQTITEKDNFFLAGGHSLLGMQLVMRLGEAFGVDLTLRQLFEAPSVDRLAAVVEAQLMEAHIAKIWIDLLGLKQVGAEENFFTLGGNNVLLGALEQRLAAEIRQTIPAEELIQYPTVRRQAELMVTRLKANFVLPPGVLALQPNGTRSRFFWCHYLTVNLAKVVGDEQPFLSVMLTAHDFAVLGASPTFEEIAACFVGKIRATQATGPYNIGGFCLGGILAFEIACQLQAAEQEVPLLVMLDTPNPSYLKEDHPLGPKLTQPRYLLKRVVDLGPRQILARLRSRVEKRFAVPATVNSSSTVEDIAQELVEAAAAEYQPGQYKGKTLLLLAADHAPHINFVPGWQAVTSGELHVQYLDGHHSDLIDPANVQRVADAIGMHLVPGADTKSFSKTIPLTNSTIVFQGA